MEFWYNFIRKQLWFRDFARMERDEVEHPMQLGFYKHQYRNTGTIHHQILIICIVVGS